MKVMHAQESNESFPPKATGRANPPLFAEAALGTRFRRMMEQQFWLWGCDIRRPEGNLIAAAGLDKGRPPQRAVSTASRYSRVIHADISLTLWGFGLAVSSPTHGVVFLPRLGLRPRCGVCGTDLTAFWDPTDFDQFERPHRQCDHDLTRLLLADALSWIATYERGVIEDVGLAYRTRSIKAWKRPVEPAAALPPHWRALANALRIGLDAGQTFRPPAPIH